MFERNRVERTPQQTSVPAAITLSCGRSLKGRFLIPSSRAFHDVLNGETKFLEFETFSGERTLLAKSTITAIDLFAVPASGGLKDRVRDTDGFDPHRELGVAATATWDEIRQAYLDLSKRYHPDRYAGVDLPPEVQDYLAAMTRRINTAYRALEMPRDTAKRAVIEKAKPIFTSVPRV